MSALGVLPRVDAAVHADTGHERSETYAFAAKWTPWLEERGVRVVTVRSEHTDVLTYKRVMLAAYTTYPDGKPSSVMPRQCTRLWKLTPIRQWLQANRDGEQVEQWIGITLDEVERMRISDVQYIENTYPFCLTLQPPWTRGKVIQWLRENDLEVPVKSSCMFCPFHRPKDWREIQLAGTGDWEKAIAVDEQIRHARDNYVCYLTSKLKPLADCDFRTQEEYGQMTFGDIEECSGMCFL